MGVEPAKDLSKRYLAQTSSVGSGVYYYGESQFAAITGARKFERIDNHTAGQLDVYDTLGFVGSHFDGSTSCMMGKRPGGGYEKLPYLFSVDAEGNFFDARRGEFKVFDYRPEKTPESESAEAG